MKDKEKCLDEIAVIRTLAAEYSTRLLALRKRENELEAELETYDATAKIVAANEPDEKAVDIKSDRSTDEVDEPEKVLLTGEV